MDKSVHPALTATEYNEGYQQSLRDPEAFWGKQANHYLDWIATFEKVVEGGFDKLDMHWFSGGKLNASSNCLDRHLANRGDQTAIIWESDDGKTSAISTYRDLHARVCRFANALRQSGIKKGDRICIYLPMIPEAVIAMLACARIGAIHSVVFGGFSAESLKNRIQDADCCMVITANEGIRGNKIIPLKQNVDKALNDCPKVKNVIVVKRTENKTAWNDKRDHWYHEVISGMETDCEPEIMDAEDPLFGTVGEPINPDAWEWYFQVVGKAKCPIVDTWWQTETGGIMISPFPGATALKPGSASWPFFGVVPEIVDDQGKVLPDGKMGHLVITQPWPGMMQTVYADHDRFAETYFKEFPGKYLTGDQASRDAEGYFWISGRDDDVLKISGHRIGTQEVESALIHHPAVSEAAVVAVSDEIRGQGIYAFVSLKTGISPSEQLKRELVQGVRDAIGPIAIVSHIQWADELPKTRSGKIMRRLLRKIANHDVKDRGDLSTLADPSVVDKLIEGSVG